MPITSSTIREDRPQRDGRRRVVEEHVDHLGISHILTYLADAGVNVSAALSTRAAELLESLKASEISQNITAVTQDGRNAVLSFNHSTIAENRAELRQAYRNATRVEAIMIGDFLASLTNTQLQSLFGLTSTQVNTLRTNKLTPAANAATAIRAAVGE